MRKIYLFLLMSVFAGAVFAQASMKKLTKREKRILEINRKVDASAVIELLRKCNNNILKSMKDKEPLPYIRYYSFAAGVDTLIKYRWLIADTGLSRKWLQEVKDLLAYMGKTRDVIQTAINNKQTQTKKYKKAMEYFNLAYNRFVKAIQKSVKVSNKVQRQAKSQKLLWQKNMRQKYKIK